MESTSTLVSPFVSVLINVPLIFEALTTNSFYVLTVGFAATSVANKSKSVVVFSCNAAI